MPPLALGASFADTSLKCIGLSGDGDSASIGLGHFKHLIRRNLPMVYIVENNGVYGLTKGQFSATSEKGLILKRQGVNPYEPIDICMEAIISKASFVARSFAGDPRQLKELLKAALGHRGIAILDVISPCVTFHNQDNSLHSYAGGKEHEVPLHDVTFVPARDEITIEDYEPGTARTVELFDGSEIILKKLDKDYDPTDHWQALRALEEAQQKHWLLTGLIYIDANAGTILENYELPDIPMNRLPAEKLRPSKQKLEEINKMMF
jgi:2-oxoglutarate ferredoxin oxidoreductase subunit beta